MSENPSVHVAPEAAVLPLAGRKLYSPGAIAAFTALANLPFGIILYGLNLKARGQRRLGLAMIWFGAASFSLLLFLSLKDALPRFFGIIGVFGAINVYSFEKRPFQQALRQGAARAAWWPPALVLVGVSALLLLLDWLR